jgi:hypothetical protein
VLVRCPTNHNLTGFIAPAIHELLLAEQPVFACSQSFLITVIPNRIRGPRTLLCSKPIQREILPWVTEPACNWHTTALVFMVCILGTAKILRLHKITNFNDIRSTLLLLGSRYSGTVFALNPLLANTTEFAPHKVGDVWFGLHHANADSGRNAS